MRKRKPHQLPKGRATRHKLKGGPLNGMTIPLHSAGTLVFTLHGQTGRYNRYNHWVTRGKVE